MCVFSHSKVADLDDEFAELLLTDFSDDFDAISSIQVCVLLCNDGKMKGKMELFCASTPCFLCPQLQEALRRVTLARKGVPILCGSSLKNKGVQPLLDAITAFLPAPCERRHDIS